MGECQCSLTISLLGDGCRYCQPQLTLDKYIEQAGDLIAANEALGRQVIALKAELAQAKRYAATYACVAKDAQGAAVGYWKNEPKPCGGCGCKDPAGRCAGCLHPFF